MEFCAKPFKDVETDADDMGSFWAGVVLKVEDFLSEEMSTKNVGVVPGFIEPRVITAPAV